MLDAQLALLVDRTPREGRSCYGLLPSQSTLSAFLCGLALFALVGICLAAYWPGLAGPFLFDDDVNLAALGHFNQIDNWHSFFQYLTSGIACPTGRPVALLSFLLNDFAWPSQPWSFKYTNLLVHALNGVLVFWISLKLCRLSTNPSIGIHGEWPALASAGLWLLHPMQVATTLYVIQRMASLAALFSLCGILLYVQGREMMQTRPDRGYVWMTVAVSLFTLLATFSKESGALLPLLLATLEFTVLRWQSRLVRHPHKAWIGVFMGIPALALSVYLAHFLIPKYVGGFAARGLTAIERGMTEARILIVYLYHLFVPKLYAGSLFNDDFPISKGLLAPQTTLLALAAIALLLAVAWRSRKTYPLASLAILFFFVGHLVESTLVPLDLYYEHRSYLPSVFLFLPLAYAWPSHRNLTIAAVLSAFLLMAGFTHAKAKLWRSEPELLLFWHQQHPDSLRAQRYAANVYYKLGLYDQALKVLELATLRHPNDIKLRLHRIVLACLSRRTDVGYIADTLGMAETTPIFFDSQILDMLEELTTLAGQSKCPGLTLDHLNHMTETILASPNVRDSKTSQFALTHLMGVIDLQRKDGTAALALFDLALELSGNPETGMLETALLATHGFYREALLHLSTTEGKVGTEFLTGVWVRHDHPKEIVRLRKQIQEDLDHSTVTH